jgi:hypothetical protein
MAKKSKKQPKRKAELDFSQIALAIVERATGEKLARHRPKISKSGK